MIWFTSDLHFGHLNIMKFCPKTRPYEELEEMDEAIIKEWNSVVQPSDTVFSLGDFSFYREPLYVRYILTRLYGHKIMLYGNHDQTMHKLELDDMLDGVVDHVDNYYEMYIDKQFVVMSHYPLAVWNKNHYGSFNLYGHCHGSFKAVGRQGDVGWDSTDFGPGAKLISWETVQRTLSKKEIVCQDHH